MRKILPRVVEKPKSFKSLTCTKCKQTKPLARFQKNSRYASGFCTWCKDCKLESQRAHPETNKNWVAENKESVTQSKVGYLERYPDRVKASKKRWYSANPKHQLALTRKYQAAKLRATPKWLSEEQKTEMVIIYKNCPKGFEVDHKTPLQGKTVRGLHVPWNLQYLPVKDNRKKSSKLV